MQNKLLKSTPFRITLLLSAIFLASLTVAGTIAFLLIRQELAKRVDDSLLDTYGVIAQAYGDTDVTDLIDSVQNHAKASPGPDQIFRLSDNSGTVVAGNLPPSPVPLGWSTIPARDLGLNGRFSYRIYVGMVGDNALLVGTSSAESDAIGQLAITTFAWAGLIFMILIVGAGMFLAQRAQRRLDAIAGTMKSIGQGELTARIPVGSRGDDVDMLSLQVNAALDRLASLVESVRQVSVDIAHDLKTPLHRLAITIEDAITRAEPGTPMIGLLNQAEEESRQINSTFDALLRIAQIEAGARRARFETQTLYSILQTIVEIYGDVALENGQVLVLEASGTPEATIAGDNELLVQLFANLVENAMRHTPAGTTIKLSLRARHEQIVVTVSDDGPGIPADERERVFRRLYRLDKSRTTPGNGLGLSLAKAIVDLHDGTIELQDNRSGLLILLEFPTDIKGL